MADATPAVKAKVAAPTVDQINADRITQVCNFSSFLYVTTN